MNRSPALSWFFSLCIVQTLFAQSPIVFEDVTEQTGLAAILETQAGQRPWRYAHGAGWGDADGDGRVDLYIGAFAARPWFEGDQAPLPNRLLLSRGGRFESAGTAELQFADRNSRCAGVLWVDLDNDADLDLVVANHVTNARHGGSRIFENLGAAQFQDVTPATATWPGRIGMRNVSAVDFDRDGRLDLLIADGSYGRAASQAARLMALRNQGGFQFSDATQDLGLPADETTGLGLALGDVNDDGSFDVFVAGSNRLLVTTSSGGYREATPGRFAFEPADAREGLHCGAAFGDLDGDGRLDLVTTEHGVPARIHVFHHRGTRDGEPLLEEVTAELGLGDLFPTGTRENPIKTAHVAICDMDLDGRRDVLLTVVYQDERGHVQPVVLRNISTGRGHLQLTRPPYDKLTTYYAPGPVADYDGDGKLDIFLPSWFENVPNRLLRNVTSGGHWLVVRVVGAADRQSNSMGVGAVVRAYRAGHLGSADHLLGRADIAVGTGYASCEEAVAHIGLGEEARCDVAVTWNGKTVGRKDVAADQRLVVEW